MLAIAFPAVMTSPGCGADAQRPVCEEPVLQRRDSGKVSFSFPGSDAVRTLDIFIYADSPTRPLLWHMRTGHTESLRFPLDGDCTAVAIANAPGEFILDALKSMDSIEKLEMQYAAENAFYPTMSGLTPLSKDEPQGVIRLTPLLCKVSLYAICNSTGRRIESLSIRFADANSSAELLRSEGFRPVQTISGPDGLLSPELFSAKFAFDIGIPTVHPGLNLYCYPNDSEEETPGTPRTTLIIEGFINKRSCTWSIPLPPIKRGADIKVEVDILSPESLNWSCF